MVDVRVGGGGAVVARVVGVSCMSIGGLAAAQDAEARSELTLRVGAARGDVVRVSKVVCSRA